MKALVFHGPQALSWEEHPDPVIVEPTDVVVRVEVATVCGTDAHVSHGVHPEVPLGTILGHEGVGTIIEIGDAVTKFRVGDRVAIPPISSCGSCVACAKGFAAHCSGAGANGWLLGHEIDGLQAELARIPFADNSLHLIPAGLSSEDAILAVDVYAAAEEMGVSNAEVSAGDTVVIIGDGPIGLAAVALAKLRNPAVIILAGIRDFRLEIATELGADHVVDSSAPGWVDQVRALCPSGGADAIIEAVGARETLEAAFDLVNTFGRIANIGVHTGPVSFPIERLWISAFTFRSGMISCTSTPSTLELLANGTLNGSALISHRLKLADAAEAYQIFDDAAETKSTKVILTR